jgi:hypothetical protein
MQFNLITNSMMSVCTLEMQPVHFSILAGVAYIRQTLCCFSKVKAMHVSGITMYYVYY